MIVVRVTKFHKWSADYIVPTTDVDIAKEVAFQNAKRTFSCTMPATKEMMENDIEIISTDAELVSCPDVKEALEMEKHKCPLCDGKFEFDTSDKITKWHCTKCGADGEVRKDNFLVICSCSAKGSMCDEVANY